MKIRTGFVSNSSSSSFIVAFGEIGNLANKLIKERGLEKYIITGEEIIEDEWFSLNYEEMGIYFDFSKKDIDPDKKYFHFGESYGDDYDFWNGDEYDYDIGIDFFPQEIQDTFNFVNEENGFKNIYSGFGAGRDG